MSTSVIKSELGPELICLNISVLHHRDTRHRCFRVSPVDASLLSLVFNIKIQSSVFIVSPSGLPWSCPQTLSTDLQLYHQLSVPTLCSGAHLTPHCSGFGRKRGKALKSIEKQGWVWFFVVFFFISLSTLKPHYFARCAGFG